MKFLMIILFCCSISSLIAQDSLIVTLYNYKTGKQIKLPEHQRSPYILIYGSDTALKKRKFYNVDYKGQVVITKSELDIFGDSLNFSVSAFYEERKFSYADFEIRNIPKSIAEIVLEKVYLTPSYWANTCGSDCFLIDNRRTFKKQSLIVKTSKISYRMKRVPEKMDQKYLAMRYVADLNQDIIKEY